MTKPDLPDLLTYPEAAKYLRRSPTTLRRDVMKGKIPVVKLYGPRGRTLFSRQALIELIDSRTRPAANDQ